MLSGQSWLKPLQICSLRPVIFLLFIVTFLSVQPAFADAGDYTGGDSMYLGFNYPGVSVGYQWDDSAVEVRGFTGSDADILIYGLRGRWPGIRFDSNVLYYGADALYVDHEGVITEGSGYMVGIFGGFRNHFTERLSFNLDMGPYQVELEDDYSGVRSDGLHFIMNVGVSIYF